MEDDSNDICHVGTSRTYVPYTSSVSVHGEKSLPALSNFINDSFHRQDVYYRYIAAVCHIEDSFKINLNKKSIASIMGDTLYDV